MKRRRKLILTRNTIRHLDVNRLAPIAGGACPTDSLTTEEANKPRTLGLDHTCATCKCGPSFTEPCN